MASADIDILESPHAIGILLYVAGHDGCRKMDVYNEVSHNSTMSRKIDSLEEAGLLVQRPMNRGLVLHLTDKGRRVSGLLADVRDALLSDGDAPSERRTTFFASHRSHRRLVDDLDMCYILSIKPGTARRCQAQYPPAADRR